MDELDSILATASESHGFEFLPELEWNEGGKHWTPYDPIVNFGFDEGVSRDEHDGHTEYAEEDEGGDEGGDSRWFPVLDAASGRTYYVHSDTNEVQTLASDSFWC